MDEEAEAAIEVKSELLSDINLRVHEYAAEAQLQHIKQLETYDPEKAAKILFLHSQGVSQTKMYRKYGLNRDIVVRVLATYADHLGQWRQLGGQLASYNYLNLSSLEEDLIEELRDQMEAGKLELGFRDLKDLSIAKANASREALTARGEATSITEERKVYTDEEYRDLRDKARARFEEMKQAEVIEDE